MEYLNFSNGIKWPKMVLGSFNISSQSVMTEIVKASYNQGVCAFDTSPSYGSEEILGNALKSLGIKRESVAITDKIDGWQMCQSNGEIEKYLDTSLRMLNTDYIDLLLVHWPFANYIVPTWKCMEKLYRKGKVRAIGLCNMNSRKYNEFTENEIEIKPHAVQNEISPFNTDDDSVKLLQSEGITVEAYSPLCRMRPDIKKNEVLNSLSAKYNKSIPQIILRWHVDRHCVPIFTSSKGERVVENTNIWDFSLDTDDAAQISSMNRNYKIFPESFGCPGY